jgi:hypothetical protein
MDHISEESIVAAPEVHQQPTPTPSDSHVPAGSTESHIDDQQNIKRMDMDEDTSAGPDMLSPMSADTDNKQEESELPALTSIDLGSQSMGYDFSNIRVCLLSPTCLLITQHSDQLCS